MAETGHWSSTPRLACNAILLELRTRLARVNGGAGAPGGSGCVRAIERIASDSELAEVKRGLTEGGGLPALLLFYGAGNLVAQSTHQRQFAHTMLFRILCCSGHWETKGKRQSGTAQMDWQQAAEPGVEELQDFAVYFGVRALAGVDGLSKVGVQRFNPASIVEPGLYIGTVDLVAQREVDVYDDAAVTTLQQLGLVHDPKDYAVLWLDPPTDSLPNSDLPHPIDGDGPFSL